LNNKYYIIGDTFSSGNFGSIIKAYSSDTGGTVVIKTIKHASTRKDYIINEINVLEELSRLFAPVSRYYTWVRESDRTHIIMSYAAGGSLETYSSEYNVTHAEIERIAYGVLCALLPLHAMNYVHRDIKPANVLLKDEPTVEPHQWLLCDFGLVKKATKGAPLNSMCGTFMYCPPEQIMKWDCGYWQAFDVWSLGIILYELVTGTHPFVRESDYTVLPDVVTKLYTDHIQKHKQKRWLRD